MSIDDCVAIQGNGNQDTQSWFHSQEANILVDSPQIVEDWLHLLKANQSTFQHGRVDHDGIYRNPETGEELEEPESISCISAMLAMI